MGREDSIGLVGFAFARAPLRPQTAGQALCDGVFSFSAATARTRQIRGVLTRAAHLISSFSTVGPPEAKQTPARALAPAAAAACFA